MWNGKESSVRAVASASLIQVLCLIASGCGVPDDAVKVDPGIVENTSSALTINSWQYKGGNGVVVKTGSPPTIYSGPVSDIEYSPALNGYRLASAGGGSFQWNGSVWFPISDSIAPTDSPPKSVSGVSMGATATHPTNPAIILAGTASVAYNGSPAGSGLWKTINSGSTWTNVLPYASTGATVYRIVWSTHTVGTVWVATTNGLFRSTDSGVTWIKVFTGQVNDIVRKPDDSVLLATMANTGVYRSPDLGGSWSAVFLIPSGSFSTITLAMDSSSGTNVYAQWGDGSQRMALAKSTNGGLNWSTIVAPNGSSDFTCGGFGFSQAIATSPDGQTVLAGCSVLARSTNGGSTWTVVSSATSDNAGPYHIVRFQNASTLLLGSDTGYHYSLDGGVTWASNANTIPIMNLNDFDARIDSPSVYFGAAQELGVFSSSDSGSTWHGVLSGIGSRMQYMTADPAAGSMRAWGSDGSTCYRTADQGATWTSFNGPLQSCGRVEEDQVPGVYLYTAGNQLVNNTVFSGIYRSTDGGNTWSVYPSTMPSLPKFPSDFATGRYNSTIGGSVIYANVGTFSAPKFVVLDPSYSSTSWRDITSALSSPSTPNFYAMRFSTSYLDYNVAFAFTDNKLWRTVSKGQAWAIMSSTTPLPSSATIWDVIEDPLNTNIWIAATSLGTYKTSDGGLTWRPWRNGLPEGFPVVYRLRGQVTGSPSTFQVFAGFQSRSIWQRDAAGDDS